MGIADFHTAVGSGADGAGVDMKQKDDREFAGFFILLAAVIAGIVFVMFFFSSEAQAWDQEQDQSQWQEMTQHLDIDVNLEIPEGGLVGAQSAPTTNVTTQGDEINVEGDTFTIQDRKQAPNVYTGAVYSTAPCRIGVGGGGSTVGAGVSVQLGLKDKGCELRNVSALFHKYGEVSYALALLCTSEAIPGELLDVCPKESSVTEYARRATEIIREEASK